MFVVIVQARELIALLVLGTHVLGGWGTLAADRSTELLDYRTLIHGPARIDGLGKRLSLRVVADSWPALVRRLKPTFAWNDCDLMWIKQESGGRPVFVLDEAYLYQSPGQPRQWVLLADRPGPFDRWYGEVMGHNLRARTRLGRSVPTSQNDAGVIGNFAVALSSAPDRGTVYEIGWQQRMANGTGLAEKNRRIFVFCDHRRCWHFLGEGPGVGKAKCGGHKSRAIAVTARVAWLTNRLGALPLAIHFTIRQTDFYLSPHGPDRDRKLVTYRQAALAGHFPAQCRPTAGHPFLLAGKHETLSNIASRLGFFQPGWQAYPERKRAAQQAQIVSVWRAALAELNPQLNQTAPVPAGTRVRLLRPEQLHARLRRPLSRATDKVNGSGWKSSKAALYFDRRFPNRSRTATCWNAQVKKPAAQPVWKPAVRLCQSPRTPRGL